MSRLDGDAVRRALSAPTVSRLDAFEAFSEIDSTNSYLMHQPAPVPGRLRVAITDNQTQGRGRHGRTWVSPAGSGLCLSLAWAFAEKPAILPALTYHPHLGIAVDRKSRPKAANVFLRGGDCDFRLDWPH